MSDKVLTLDEMLSEMYDAMEAENFWDTEAYAIMALDYLDSDKKTSADSEIFNWSKEQLKEMLISTRDAAIEMASREKNNNLSKAPMVLTNSVTQYTEEEKASLINEIINFRG
jgi:hypothetical protein